MFNKLMSMIFPPRVDENGKMNKRMLDKNIKPLLKEMGAELPFGNSGGCSIIAYGLSKHIVKNYADVEPSIMYLFSRYDNSEYANVIENKEDSCAHVVLKVGDSYYDTHGVHTFDRLKTKWRFGKTFEVTDKFAMDSINKADWNPCFNRRHGVPIINKILELDNELDVVLMRSWEEE